MVTGTETTYLPEMAGKEDGKVLVGADSKGHGSWVRRDSTCERRLISTPTQATMDRDPRSPRSCRNIPPCHASQPRNFPAADTCCTHSARAVLPDLTLSRTTDLSLPPHEAPVYPPPPPGLFDPALCATSSTNSPTSVQLHLCLC
jgi:hypothetical protein